MALLWVGMLGAGFGAGCSEEPPKVAEAIAAVPRQRVATLSSGMSVELPVDLVVQSFARSLFATSPDGGYRFYLGERAESLVEALAAFKDELTGLGWDIESEQHFASAMRVNLYKGPKQARIYRQTWLVGLKAPEDKPCTAVCEGIAREPHRARLDDVLRKVCEGIEAKAGR